MKIAQLSILENITLVEFTALLQDPNEKINVDFLDRKGNIVTVDIKPYILEGKTFFKQVFDFADYHLHKDETMFLIINEDNKFNLKAQKLIDTEDNVEDVLEHTIRLKVSTNTGNLVGKIIDTKDFKINISEDITDEIKAELLTSGVTLTGSKWNDFEVSGKTKIEFEKISNATIFVGNKLGGFLIN